MGIGKALGKMWREEGLRGFMRGNGANCVRIVPYSAVQFGSYNFYKRVCLHNQAASDMGVRQTCTGESMESSPRYTGNRCELKLICITSSSKTRRAQTSAKIRFDD